MENPNEEEIAPPTRCEDAWNTIKNNKCTIVLLILVCDMILGVSTYFYIVHFYYTNVPSCQSTNCVVGSAEIIKKIDRTSDPCADFHQFACLAFEDKTVLPAFRSHYNIFTQLQDVVDEQLRFILNEPIYAYDTRGTIIVKTLYRACMNRKLVESNSLTTLRTIYQKLGGWPVLENKWNDTLFNWETISYQLMLEGLEFHTLFRISVLPDKSNSSKYQIALFQPNLQEFEKYLLSDSEDLAIEGYYKYMVQIVEAFGARSQQAYTEMQDVINFCIELVGLLRPIEHILTDDSSLQIMKIGELERKYPYVRWLQYINNLFNSTNRFHFDDVVVVTAPAYFEQLGPLLQNTSKRVLANYMFWQVTKDMARFLSERIRHATANVLNLNTGTVDHIPRSRLCVENTLLLDVAMGALVTRRIYVTDSGDAVKELMRNLKSQLVIAIDTVGWMDHITRYRALEKAANLSALIGYTKEFLDDNFIEKYYQDLFINENNYVDSILKVKIFQHKKFYQQQDKLINRKATFKNRWLSVASVKAFYNPFENLIEIPAGLLQGIIFNEYNPSYLNYAGLGYVIGREMIRAFDSEGQQFYKNGSLFDWWKYDTKAAYKMQSQCMIDQYSNITVSEFKINLDGVQTLEDNIADNAGLMLAYNAYKRWTQFHRDELKLPGLPYNPLQLFWIAFAQQYCTLLTSEEVRSYVYEGSQMLPKYRINIPLMNSYDFASDFNCPRGSNMNPIQKCRVW